jgi:hypothetical protein
VKRAFELSKEFTLALGASDAVDWDERGAVLYAMLQEAYGDVLATGRWLLREQPGEGERRFPKLVPYRGGARGGASTDDTTEEGDDATDDVAPANDSAVAQPAADAPAAPPAPAPAAAKEPAKKAPTKKTPAKKAGR